MYAKGMSQCDITDIIDDIYGFKLSAAFTRCTFSCNSICFSPINNMPFSNDLVIYNSNLSRTFYFIIRLYYENNRSNRN